MLKEKQLRSFDDGVRHAARRAYDNKGACFSVYVDEEAVYVRASEAAPPPGATRVVIAQHWSGNTVQLRYAGARTEFINF